MNINFSIVNQFNSYQICYRNPNFVTISRDMRYTVDQILGKRGSQTQQVFNLAGI